VCSSDLTDAETGAGQAEITATAEDGGSTATCVVRVTMEPQEAITSLKPLKDSFKDYFWMGNILNPSDMEQDGGAFKADREYITRHYNFLTFENLMKPAYMCGEAPGEYNAANIARAKSAIAAAKAKGIQFHGHCLMWHGGQMGAWQNVDFFNSHTNEEVLGFLREYITRIVTEFKGTLHSWDVLNEAIADNPSADWRTSIRTENPWFAKLGADFIYEGFLAARLADPGAILYYNDYNLDVAAKAQAVYNMVSDINARYRNEYPQDGQFLINGIGMQCHENAGVTAASVRAAIDLFRQLGVTLSITEFDVLANTFNDHNTQRPVTNAKRLAQANQYHDFFKVFLENDDIIERVSFWGNHDGASWRGFSEPMPFAEIGGTIKAKPAYYKMIEALESMGG
jgi:endo-1,4-beta-xylanase